MRTFRGVDCVRKKSKREVGAQGAPELDASEKRAREEGAAEQEQQAEDGEWGMVFDPFDDGMFDNTHTATIKDAMRSPTEQLGAGCLCGQRP